MFGRYYYKFSNNAKWGTCRIVAIDTETAKNWRSTIKFIPFCASFFSIYYDSKNINQAIDIENLYIECEVYFRDNEHSTSDYLKNVNNMIGRYLNSPVKTTIVGHQLTIDLFSLKNMSSEKLDNVELLIERCKKRKMQENDNLQVDDTRYDIQNRIIGEEKLRTVSLRLNIFAVQNELEKLSLTKQYNKYIGDNDTLKRERLIIMNLRHSFQTALVWLRDAVYSEESNIYKSNFITTNDMIYKLCKKSIGYVSTSEFSETLDRTKILSYVRKYMPEHIFLKSE